MVGKLRQSNIVFRLGSWISSSPSVGPHVTRALMPLFRNPFSNLTSGRDNLYSIAPILTLF